MVSVNLTSEELRLLIGAMLLKLVSMTGEHAPISELHKASRRIDELETLASRIDELEVIERLLG